MGGVPMQDLDMQASAVPSRKLWADMETPPRTPNESPVLPAAAPRLKEKKAEPKWNVTPKWHVERPVVATSSPVRQAITLREPHSATTKKMHPLLLAQQEKTARLIADLKKG